MFNDADGTTILKTLTSTVNDSVKGYRDAAENDEAGQFRSLFTEMADERSRVAEDLRAAVRRAGGEPDEDGSVLGSLHQRWLDLKAAVTGQDEKAIVNEVERGEDYLKEKFEAALKSDALDADSRSIVERAYGSVRQGHDRISALKHRFEDQPSQ